MPATLHPLRGGYGEVLASGSDLDGTAGALIIRIGF